MELATASQEWRLRRGSGRTRGCKSVSRRASADRRAICVLVMVLAALVDRSGSKVQHGRRADRSFMTCPGLPVAWCPPTALGRSSGSCQESSLPKLPRPRERAPAPADPSVPATRPRVLSRPVNQRTGSPHLSGEHAAEHRREPRRSRPPDRAMPAESAHPAATPGNSTPSTRPPQTTPPRGSSPRGGLDRCLQRAGSSSRT